ncbi:Asp23/Gls24 family envelope stress response protein [Rhodococcus sovatensis]|uniref:Asp23/Gls24 family envelope stress response protein n=1 Tax=Rhodococcus sovatensis TaxID=1805840 RepID=A0ABZ2PFY6_9NOCA
MTEQPDISEVIADAVLATSGVAGLHGGMFGEAATYLPGRRVSGIRISDDGVEVHVTVAAGNSIRETADAIRTAVSALSNGPVHVTVEDVVRV